MEERRTRTSTENKLLVKIEKSSNNYVKFVTTENDVFGIESNTNSDIHVCETNDQSIVVFDENLRFIKRLKLKSYLVSSLASSYSVKLYDDLMYVMFGHPLSHSPLFNLQVFTLEGELVRYLIKKNEICCSFFFSIDQLGNIIVSDGYGDQIRIFTKEGVVLHTITSDMLPEDHKFDCPYGIALDKQNRIIVAQRNNKCNLLASNLPKARAVDYVARANTHTHTHTHTHTGCKNELHTMVY